MDAKAISDALEFAREELRLVRDRRRHYSPGTYSEAMRLHDEDHWTTIVQALEAAQPRPVNLARARALRDNDCRELTPLDMLGIAATELAEEHKDADAAVMIARIPTTDGGFNTVTWRANLRRTDELALLTIAQHACMHRMRGDDG